MIKHASLGFAAVVSAALLAGCNTNGISETPAGTQVNLSSLGTLQLAVGTVNNGYDSHTIGLNTVVTYRQANGLSAVLLDTPKLTGPASFKNTGGSAADPYDDTTKGANCFFDTLTAGSDFGTASISGDVQAPSTNARPTHTFGEAGLAAGYGIQPDNSAEGGGASYAGNINRFDCGFGSGFQYQAYPEPFYISATAVSALQALGMKSAPTYLGGPPAFPFFADGSGQSGFAGYVSGFTAFQVAPVAGAYTLTVNVPAANAPSTTATATATLTSTAPLPAIGAPAFVSDGAGGGSGTIAVPADPRITETMVYVHDQNNGSNFSIGPIKGTGTLAYRLPDNYGSCVPIGCQTTAPAPTLSSGDTIFVYAVTADYPLFEAAPPANTSQAPTITGAGGQADISLSPVTAGTE